MNHCLCILYLKWRHFTKNMSKSISANGFTQFNRSRSRRKFFSRSFFQNLQIKVCHAPPTTPSTTPVCSTTKSHSEARERETLMNLLDCNSTWKISKKIFVGGVKKVKWWFSVVRMDRYISLLKPGNSRSTNIMGNPGLWPTNQLIKKTLNNSPVNIW